jgi:hypothetical protein
LDHKKPYASCPYCLTEIPEIETIEITTFKEMNAEKTKDNSNKMKENPSDCQFHLGYLSEREQKMQIPEDCIICKDIINCMLKKMKN